MVVFIGALVDFLFVVLLVSGGDVVEALVVFGGLLVVFVALLVVFGLVLVEVAAIQFYQPYCQSTGISQ